jgi:glutamate/tyrosine decarboxylase-like PLP-dependent enzyme
MTSADLRRRAALAGRPALLEDAARRARAYLAGVARRGVAPAPAAMAALAGLDFPLPDRGRDAAEVLALLDEVGSPATVASAGPRYFGFVTGGALPVAVAAAWLTAAWDQNAALALMSPAAARLDAVALRWVSDLLGLSCWSTTEDDVDASLAAIRACAAA